MIPNLSPLIGESAAMRRLRQVIARIAESRLPVLIEGETGTGKELVATAIHNESGRHGNLVAFNVCAIPETMFESTMFGHARGAFTGAMHSNEGLLSEANHGTAFFDEIGTLSMTAQGKLLRAIETGVYRPVGARIDHRSDFRVIAASNESLAKQVSFGAFRADLAHRLSGCLVHVPPLRERREDIPLLVDTFVKRAGSRRMSFPSETLDILIDHDWPGNVRELRMTIERLAVLAEDDVISTHALALILPTVRDVSLHDSRRPFADKRVQLETVLDDVEQDTARAAQALGIHRSTLYRRLASLGIQAPTKRERSR